MAGGQENLIPFASTEQAREAGRKGGINAQKTHRAKKQLRELVEYFGRLTVEGDAKRTLEKLGVDADKFTRDMQIVVSLYNKAAKGDVGAFNAIRDIRGEKPREELALNAPNTLRIEIVGDMGKEFPSSEDEIKE